MGWLLALVYNALGDVGVQLPERYHRAHVETLRRTYLNRSGRMYLTPAALIVYLDPFPGQQDLVSLLDDVNAQQCRLPWLDNRRLVLSLTPAAHAQRGGP